MTTSRDPDRLIRAFLQEGEEELPDRLYDVVRAEIEQTGQRVFIGPWRFPTMNRFLSIGAAAAVIVVALIAGAQLFGSPSNTGGPEVEPTPTPQPTANTTASPTPDPTAEPSAWTGLPEGAFVIADEPVRVTVNMTAPGWTVLQGLDAITKNDDGLDSPDSVGGAFVAWGFPVGSEFLVYGDPCDWVTTTPETAATTPDEIATALGAQAQTETTTPVDVTIGGYSGKAITLEVPMSYEVPGATREEEFAACDESTYAFYGVSGEPGPTRNAQGPGQIDELWILDVDGAIMILDATYGPAAPAELVAEMRALAESATFGAP